MYNLAQCFMFSCKVHPLHQPPFWVLQGLFRPPWQPSQVGGSIHNCWCSQVFSAVLSSHTHAHNNAPCTSLHHPPLLLPPQLLLLLPPDLSLPQLLPPGLAQSLQEASQLPLLSPAVKKEKQAKEENKTSGIPRKAIWVILFERLEVIAAIYTGKKREKKRKNRPHFHTYQP